MFKLTEGIGGVRIGSLWLLCEVERGRIVSTQWSTTWEGDESESLRALEGCIPICNASRHELPTPSVVRSYGDSVREHEELRGGCARHRLPERAGSGPGIKTESDLLVCAMP